LGTDATRSKLKACVARSPSRLVRWFLLACGRRDPRPESTPRITQFVVLGMSFRIARDAGTLGVAVVSRLLVLDQQDGLGHHGNSGASLDEQVEVQRRTTVLVNHQAVSTRAAITIAMM
jgi:hypothetical protein